MENDKIVTFQLQLTRRKAWLLITAFFICWRPGFLGSETLTLTTYYPAPFGGYTSLLTTGKTLLARDSNMVGIGLATPLNKLHIQGTGGGTVDLRVNGRIQTGDGSAAGGMWLSQNNDMFVGQNGTTASFWTGGNWRFNINQAGAISTGASLPLGSDVAGDVRIGGTIWGVCRTVGYTLNGGGAAQSCSGNERVVTWYGNGTATSGMLFLGGALENPAAWSQYVSVGADRGGSLLCCRIQ